MSLANPLLMPVIGLPAEGHRGVRRRIARVARTIPEQQGARDRSRNAGDHNRPGAVAASHTAPAEGGKIGVQHRLEPRRRRHDDVERLRGRRRQAWRRRLQRVARTRQGNREIGERGDAVHSRDRRRSGQRSTAGIVENLQLHRCGRRRRVPGGVPDRDLNRRRDRESSGRGRRLHDEHQLVVGRRNDVERLRGRRRQARRSRLQRVALARQGDREIGERGDAIHSRDRRRSGQHSTAGVVENLQLHRCGRRRRVPGGVPDRDLNRRRDRESSGRGCRLHGEHELVDRRNDVEGRRYLVRQVGSRRAQRVAGAALVDRQVRECGHALHRVDGQCTAQRRPAGIVCQRDGHRGRRQVGERSAEAVLDGHADRRQRLAGSGRRRLLRERQHHRDAGAAARHRRSGGIEARRAVDEHDFRRIGGDRQADVGFAGDWIEDPHRRIGCDLERAQGVGQPQICAVGAVIVRARRLQPDGCQSNVG